ncbi:MucBP domain-containing protein, partial [Enterococcus faecalis]
MKKILISALLSIQMIVPSIAVSAETIGTQEASDNLKSRTDIPINLINGGFEQPGNISNVEMYDQTSVPGWNTTASDNLIEFQKDGFEYISAYEGSQWAELNATRAGALWQDVATKPGSIVYWQVAHRGRLGTDTAKVRFGKPGSNLTEIATMTTDQQWKLYSGYYKIPVGQTTTRFQFEASSTATGDDTVGNLIDDIKFTSQYTASKVYVDYVDGKGNKLTDSETLVGDEGTDYTTTEKKITGYVL